MSEYIQLGKTQDIIVVRGAANLIKLDHQTSYSNYNITLGKEQAAELAEMILRAVNGDNDE